MRAHQRGAVFSLAGTWWSHRSFAAAVACAAASGERHGDSSTESSPAACGLIGQWRAYHTGTCGSAHIHRPPLAVPAQCWHSGSPCQSGTCWQRRWGGPPASVPHPDHGGSCQLGVQTPCWGQSMPESLPDISGLWPYGTLGRAQQSRKIQCPVSGALAVSLCDAKGGARRLPCRLQCREIPVVQWHSLVLASSGWLRSVQDLA